MDNINYLSVIDGRVIFVAILTWVAITLVRR
jgi:hypothetical protein